MGMTEQISALHERLERIEKALQQVVANDFEHDMSALHNGEPVKIDQQAVPLKLIEVVDRIAATRKARRFYFDVDILSSPAWSILLDLFHAELHQEPLSVSSTCFGSGVPATTELRYIKSLEEQGLVERRPDPADKRRTHLVLSRSASIRMTRYFNHIATRCLFANPVRRGG